MEGEMLQVTRRLAGALALCGLLGASATSAFAASVTRTSSFTYDAATGLLTTEIVEPGNNALKLETDYAYDAFGNKTQVTVNPNTPSGASMTARISTTAFDGKGQFVNENTVNPTTNTNTSQSETWQYDPHFGKPTSHTGPNGLTTTWTYDSFGRKISELRPDGTQTKWSYQFCSSHNGGTATCVTGAVYLIQATPYASASGGGTQNGPSGTVYFDMLDREIARDTQGFDASTIRVSKVYDNFGRVQEQSRPYFANGGTAEWTTYTYDALARVLLETRPDTSTTQHTYSGLVTTDTNANNQSRKVTKDSQGHVIQVTDANGKNTSYAYDPFSNLIATTDANGNTVTATYDVRGRKIASNDPDLGVWTYSYDTANELVSQTDAKHQATTITYDLLGRMTQRVEPDMTSVWTYDTASNGIGKLASTSTTGLPRSRYQRSFTYDGLTRPTGVTITIASTNYTFAATYDPSSRLSTVTYPSGLMLTYTYTSLGYAQNVTGPSNLVYWTANARDAELHLTQATAGNGVVTNQTFNPANGRLTNILAGTGSIVENFSYTYDALGNVLTRADANENNLTETFQYDNLNRLTQAMVSQNIALVKNFTYDFIGNLLTKSDVGNYTYPAAGSALPHAVTSISNGSINTSFTYDPNGNQTAGLGRSISYTSYNKPSSITQGVKTLFFSYDTDHQRFQQKAPEGNTLYFDAFGVHAELFSSATSQWNDYLMVGGTLIGVRFLHSDETVSTRYFHPDNLGSIAVITNESGAVVERDGYDAWGKRRFPSGADDPANSITSQTTRGFTAQEELADVGLVHLNGRVYDPLIGRMMSADPFVPDPMNGQAWNRYSYVINNPLAFTDPSGYCFLGLCGSIGNFLNRTVGALFRDIGQLIRDVPILGNIIEIAAVALCYGTGVTCAITAAFTATTFVTGVSSGKLGYALKSGLIAAATAGAFYAIGNLTDAVNGSPIGSHTPPAFGSPAYAFNIAGHALVGCASAEASGGNCGPAALAGAVGSAAGPFVSKNFVVGLAETTVLGGVASVAGGGKFANGATTAAFGYLFNYVAKIFSDDAFGGHTIDRHVGKDVDYLQDRLSSQPNIDAASTYTSLTEANAVTQRILDQNEPRIDNWLANASAGDRLVLSILAPFTSPNFVPFGLVLTRDLQVLLPGNGAKAVIVRAPNLANGFYVLTSYPTLNGIPFRE
jgi:RHS repeat-associated protein